MSDKKIGEYAYVTPENDVEKALQEKKSPKDRMLKVERLQTYEVTLQDMFAMREHYKQEALNLLKGAVGYLRDYKPAMVQVKTWEDQIITAMKDIPELAEGNSIDTPVTVELVNEFTEICSGLEARHNEMAALPVVPDRSENLESLK